MRLYTRKVSPHINRCKTKEEKTTAFSVYTGLELPTVKLSVVINGRNYTFVMDLEEARLFNKEVITAIMAANLNK